VSRRQFIGTIGIGAVAWACGGGKKPSGGVPAQLEAEQVTTEVALRDTRMSFALLTKDGKPYDPGRTVTAHVVLTGPDGGTHALDVPSQSVRFGGGEQHTDIGAEVHDIYPFRSAFDTPGTWQLQATVGKTTATLAFPVIEKSDTAMIGAKAIPSQSPTNADHRGVDPVCTRTPECSMHDLTIAQAITSGKPSVLVFATPKFCTSRTCGPLVDVVEGVKAKLGDKVAFVHIEEWKSEQAVGDVDNGLAPTFKEWNLPTDPWLFFVGADGVVKDRWSGAAGPNEVEAAVRQLAGG
jgi:hypothetical protein